MRKYYTDRVLDAVAVVSLIAVIFALYKCAA
jgi:hypothetical protein